MNEAPHHDTVRMSRADIDRLRLASAIDARPTDVDDDTGEVCPKCEGEGSIVKRDGNGASFEKCDRCNGKGIVRHG